MAVDQFSIVSNGFEPLLIGMDQVQIGALLGEQPVIDGPGLPEESAFRYPRSHVRVVTRENAAVELALTPPANVVYRGQPLFGNRHTWRAIVAADGDAREILGFVILLKLCLTLTGFHDDDRSQLAITAFKPGRWDAFRSKMKPLSL